MRWIMLAVSLLGFAISFSTQSVGVLVLGLLLAIGGLVGAVFAFAAARVESVAQGQSSRELSILLDAKKHGTPAGSRAKPAPVSAPAPASAPPRRDLPRAERGVDINFSVGGLSPAGAKSGKRGTHDQDRGENDGGDGGGGD